MTPFRVRLLSWIVGRIPTPWIKAIARAQWRHAVLKRLYDRGVARFRGQAGTVQHGIAKGLKFAIGQGNAGFLLGTSEPRIQEVMATLLRPAMTMYDVGANVGFYTVIAARLVGPNGRVIAFEPVPETARQLSENAELNGFGNVTAYCEALGATDGREAFVVSAESTLSRLAIHGASIRNKVSEIQVTVRRLDGLVAERRLPKPDVMKIDVEGAEAGVLTGAAGTLRAARPILVIELHGTNEVVSKILHELDYTACVVGHEVPMTQAPWNAHVVAVPNERPDLSALAAHACAIAGRGTSE